jgi:hypothetical protein
MPTIIGIRVAQCSKQTGQWLTELLREKGLDVQYKVPGEALVCYGWGIENSEVPVLNEKSGVLNNLEQLKVLSKAGLNTPTFVTDIRQADFERIKFPLLARSERHDGGGFDIQPVFQAEEIPWRVSAGASYFTEYIPRKTEYRVWVYRRRILAVYQKEMKHPEKYIGIGCNEKDGFEHVFKEDYATHKGIQQVLEMSAKAVFALGLDFGGVDIIVSKTHSLPYILEVNSAPGANGPEAVGLSKLASSIARWVAARYPKQKKEFTLEGEV